MVIIATSAKCLLGKLYSFFGGLARVFFVWQGEAAGNKKRFFPQENLFVFGVRAATGAASAEAAESAG